MTYPYLEVAEKKAQGLYDEALKLAETAAQSACTDALKLEEEIRDVVRQHRKAAGTFITIVAVLILSVGAIVQTGFNHDRQKIITLTNALDDAELIHKAKITTLEQQRDAAIAEAKRVPVCPPVVKAPVKPAPKARVRRGVKPVTHQEVPQTTWKLFPWM